MDTEYVYILLIKNKEGNTLPKLFSTEKRILDYIEMYLKKNYLLPKDVDLPFCIYRKKIDEWEN